MKRFLNTLERIALWTLTITVIPVAVYTACIGEYAASAMCVMLFPLIAALAVHQKESTR